jgi:hypothetical protein
MKTSATMPRWGQLAIGGVTLAIAVAAGATSLTINIVHHLQTDLTSAVAFGLADIGKLAVPVVAAAVGWSTQMRATLIVCALASMASVSIHLYDTHGQALFARDAQATTYAGAQADIERTRTELAAITETGTPDALAAAAQAAQKRAEAEAANGGCRRACLAAQAEATAFLERQGKAQRRAALETQLAAAKAEARTTGAAQASGDGRKYITMGMAALGLLLLETLVYLSIPATAMIAAALRTGTGTGRGGRGPRRTKGGPDSGQRGTAAGQNVVTLRPMTFEQAAAAGLSQRRIAEITGLSKSTVQRKLFAMRAAMDQQKAIAL